MLREYRGTVKVLFDGAEQDWTISVVEDSDREVEDLTLIGPGGVEWNGSGGNAWDSLRDLRRHFEVAGGRICCNGSRTNAWVSSMAISMADGAVVYLTRKGWPVRSKDLVEIFAYAPPNTIGSLEEQELFHEEWLRTPRRWWRRLLGL